MKNTTDSIDSWATFYAKDNPNKQQLDAESASHNIYVRASDPSFSGLSRLEILEKFPAASFMFPSLFHDEDKNKNVLVVDVVHHIFSTVPETDRSGDDTEPFFGICGVSSFASRFIRLPQKMMIIYPTSIR